MGMNNLPDFRRSTPRNGGTSPYWPWTYPVVDLWILDVLVGRQHCLPSTMHTPPPGCRILGRVHSSAGENSQAPEKRRKRDKGSTFPTPPPSTRLSSADGSKNHTRASLFHHIFSLPRLSTSDKQVIYAPFPGVCLPRLPYIFQNIGPSSRGLAPLTVMMPHTR